MVFVPPLYPYFDIFVNRTALDRKENKIQLVPLDFWNMLDLFLWIKLEY